MHNLFATAMLKRPIRVCFLIDRLLPAGTESQLVALIRNLNPDRVQPFLCLLDGEDALSRSLEPANCPVLRLGVRSLTRPQTIARAWRLARFLRAEQIDVLQVYVPDSTYFGVAVGRCAGVPYIIRTRNNLNHWMTPTHRLLGRALNRLVTATIANSEACRQAVLADEQPPPQSVIVLENGVDLARFRNTVSASRTNGDGWATLGDVRHVGAVANLRPVKGLETLVEAAARVRATHPNVKFQVAGEGEHRPDLERRIAQLGLTDQFALPGSVADIPGFLAHLDVAVLCSLAEGMPNAVLEYMAAGRAIVATAVGGTLRLIEDGVHGLLVPPGDPDALAKAIGRLLDEPGLATRLGTAARRRVEEKYSREVMVRSFEAFYHQLVIKGRIHGN
jgi:glycosyltransferase involved in cell wall biosynthesis